MKHSRFILIVLICIVFIMSCASNQEMQSQMIDSTELYNEYILLSQEYSELKNYDKALELLFKAENLTAIDNELRYMIARTAALAKQWNTSISYYNMLLLIDSENLLLQKSLAWVHAQSGDILTAIKIYQDLYNNHRYDKEICTNYILVLIANESYDEAQIIFNAYSSLYPQEENLTELETLILENI